MGRKYERKTSKERNATAIKMAIEEVEKRGTSIRKAALKFSVPRSTLMGYLDRRKTGNAEFKLATYSVRQVLISEMEQELGKYLLKCSSMWPNHPTPVAELSPQWRMVRPFWKPSVFGVLLRHELS